MKQQAAAAGRWQPPDWKNLSAYPDPRRVSVDFIEAAYLMRCERFRDEFSQAERLAKGNVLRKYGVAMPVLKEWGYDSPVIFDRPPYEIRARGEPRVAVVEAMKQTLVDVLKQPEFLAFAFDLRQPPDKQLAHLKRILRGRATAAKAAGMRMATKVQRAGRADHRAMLRVLDAVASGATQREIAQVLFPGESDPERGRDRVRKLLKEGRRMVNGGYRELGVLGPPGRVEASGPK